PAPGPPPAPAPARRPSAGRPDPWHVSCCKLCTQVTLLCMEPTLRRPPPGGGEPAVTGRLQRVSRAGRRRRPSGEAPPLPRTLNRSGRLWLGAARGGAGGWGGGYT